MNKPYQYGDKLVENFIKQSVYRRATGLLTSLDKEGGYKPFHRGYYTGAFDMFHYGHLLGIQNALKYCDQLIVAVSTDEVIREYKHREPIIPFEQRLAIVSAIKGVSIAIPQHDLYDKLGPVNALGCDVIFTSSEYLRSNYTGKEMTPKEQAGVERWETFQEQAMESGLNVIYLPRTDSVSTTEIKDRVVTQQQQLITEEKSYIEDDVLIPNPNDNFSVINTEQDFEGFPNEPLTQPNPQDIKVIEDLTNSALTAGIDNAVSQ